MLDVTELVAKYRIALRFLWNSCIFADPARRHWDAVESWDRLKLPIYNCLISDALDIDDAGQTFGEHFHVKPSSGIDQYGLLLINISEPTGSTSGVWSQYKKPITAADADLTLVDTFDWAQLQYRDLHYFMVRIKSFAPDETMVGRYALVEAAMSAVFWDPGVEPERGTELRTEPPTD
jgi:hypothetical protein